MMKGDPELAQAISGNDLNRLQKMLQQRHRQRAQFKQKENEELVLAKIQKYLQLLGRRVHQMLFEQERGPLNKMVSSVRLGCRVCWSFWHLGSRIFLKLDTWEWDQIYHWYTSLLKLVILIV